MRVQRLLLLAAEWRKPVACRAGTRSGAVAHHDVLPGAAKARPEAPRLTVPPRQRFCVKAQRAARAMRQASRHLRVHPLALLAAASLSVSAWAQTATPSPALLVLNKEDAALVIVDPATNQITARIPTGPQPNEVAVSEDGRFAFATNYGTETDPGTTLSVIDLTARTGRQVSLGDLRRPHGIWVTGGKVYFTAEESRMVGRYDPATGMVDATYPTNQDRTHMVLLTRNGRRMFTANISSNSVDIFERRGNNLELTIVDVGPGPKAIDLSPNERQIWTAHSGDGGVSIIDVASKKVVATLPRLNQRPNRLKFTPNGKYVLISDSGNGELVVVDAATHAEVKRLKLGSIATGIQIAPDGSLAYVALEGDNQVAIVDLAEFTVTGRFSPGAGPAGMAWAVRK